MVATVLCSTTATADPADALCHNVRQSVDTVADFTKTICFPAAGRSKSTSSFTLISEKPVFSNEKSKKVWLIVVCGAVGSELNKRGAVTADELWLSDVDHTKRRIAFVVSAQACKSLQARVYSNEISLEKMYSELSTRLVRREVGK
jgi:hypothetical protein